MAFVLPQLLLIFFLTLFVINIGSLHYQAIKTQIVADNTLLSSLRVRAEGLRTIADRWNQRARYFLEGDSLGATVSFSDWTGLEKESEKLEKAIPGYKGRIKAVITVVAEANGWTRDNLEVLDDRGSALGIVPESLLIHDERGQTRIFQSIWYRRLWDVGNRLGHPDEEAVYQAKTKVVSPVALFPALESRELKRQAAGRLVWDVKEADPFIQRSGNGGYPRRWEEALVENRVEPFRYPAYRAVLWGDRERRPNP